MSNKFWIDIKNSKEKALIFSKYMVFYWSSGQCPKFLKITLLYVIGVRGTAPSTKSCKAKVRQLKTETDSPKDNS